MPARQTCNCRQPHACDAGPRPDPHLGDSNAHRTAPDGRASPRARAGAVPHGPARMTGATTPLVAGLPDRPDDVVAGLPDAFRPSQVASLPSSICWHRDGWLSSTHVWGDRRLARYETSGGAW